MKAKNNDLIRLLSALSAIIAISFLLLSCEENPKPQSGLFSSYRDIPGVTQDEINAVEALRAKYGSFNYTMLSNTEAFYDTNGEIKGYIAHISNWLTDLFDIKFIPVIEDSWDTFLEGLENGNIDFTGDLTATPERLQSYFMTDEIANRLLIFLRIDGSPALSDIKKNRLPRYILLEGSTITEDVLKYYAEDFEPVFVSDFRENYNLLKSGVADAIITENTTEAYYDQYGDVVKEDFFPMIYSPVSLSTKNPELEPVISVVQKALKNGAGRHLEDLYEKGTREYKKHKLSLWLTEEEKAYIKNNPVILFGAEFDNYPSSFYNQHAKQWQGICFDFLEEFSYLTDLEIKIPHNATTEFHELLRMLESGEVSVVSEVIITEERQGRFLWPKNSFLEDKPVLISMSTKPNINFLNLYSMKVGLTRDSAYVEFFNNWFPNHPDVVLFNNQEDNFEALTRGEIDLSMNSYRSLLYMTNYKEQVDFKANIVFNEDYKSTFGFNLNEAVLCSIFDKVYQLVDVDIISEQWLHRTYDYRLRIAQERIPFAYSIALLFLLLSVSVIIALIINKRKNRTIAEQASILDLERKTTTNFIYANKLRDALSSITKSPALSAGVLKEAADVIAKEGCIALNTHLVIIWSTTEDAQVLTCITSYDKNEMKHSVFQDLDLLPYKEYAKLLISERLIVTNKISESSVLNGFIGNYSPGICALLDAPIRVDGKLAGVVCIEQNKCEEYPDRREWTIEEQNFASSLADLMALAISGEERLKARDAAERASKAKSNFLANMSHEIRTPMNAILGITEILLHDETLPENVFEGLGKIYNSCDLLLGIINDILDFSKIEAGRLDIIPAEYNIASLINDSIHLNLMRIENKPIRFELEIDKNIPAKLIGDELRIKQILNNLLSNAFKYTDKGKITLSVYCEPYTEGTLIVVRVADTGHGMTREQIEKLFSEYYRFVKKTTIEGTGLGLAITRRLVTLMDGEIHVESEPNKGSLFTVYLPQGTVDNEVLGDEVVENLSQFRQSYSANRTKTKIIRDPMPYGSVLIVDDVETNIDVAVGLLNLYSLKTEAVSGGYEAIEKVKAGKIYDIIFMDHMMPELDGIETTKILRDLGYIQPIVALTANAVAGQAELFIQNGFDDFISKPINIRQLNAVLNRLIRDKQPPEVLQAARAQHAALAGKNNGAEIDLSEAKENRINPQLLVSFIRDAKRTAALLEKIIKTGDLETDDNIRRLVISVHGIKSSLLNIGEKTLSDSAFKIETSARKGKAFIDKNTIAQFLKSLYDLLERLDVKPEQTAAAEDVKELRKALIAIKEISSEYDRKSILDIINGIEGRSNETNKVFENIKECVLHSDFDEAGSIAASYAYELGVNE